MYNILNDDCWLQVLQYLELRDQLSLAQTSERMSFVLRIHWKSLKKATLDEDVQNYFLQNPNIMHEFLECCSGSLVRLDLDRVIISLLESWECYNFDKLIFLNCDNRNSDMDQADKDTALMTKLFPAVVHLMLRSKTSGLYLYRWSKMRDLHLLLHGPINPTLLSRTIEILPLYRLSVLSFGYNENLLLISRPIVMCRTICDVAIDDRHLLNAIFSMHRFTPFPTAQRVSFYIQDEINSAMMLKLIAIRRRMVSSLIFEDVFDKYEYIYEAIMQMKKLEGLTFQKDAIGFLSLKQICTQLTNLKSLGLIKMRSMPSASNIWKAVAVCKSLKFLNLSHSNLDKKFLDITTEELDKSLSSYSPSSPLVLNAFNTFLQRCPQKDIPMFNHPNLKISFEPHFVAIGLLKNWPFVNMTVVTSQDSGDMNDQ